VKLISRALTSDNYTEKEKAMENNQRQRETPVTEEKKGKRKWLSRIGNFLMMGGFLLVLVLGVVIFILISVLTRGC
jgi:cell division protein FtsL